MLDFPVFRFVPLLRLSTQDFSDKKKKNVITRCRYCLARWCSPPSGKRWLIIARFPAKLFINALHGPSPDSPEDGVMRYPGERWIKWKRAEINFWNSWYYLSFVSCIFNDNPVVFLFSFHINIACIKFQENVKFSLFIEITMLILRERKFVAIQ